MKRLSVARPCRSVLVPCLGLAMLLRAESATLFVDDFDNNDPNGTAAFPTFWTPSVTNVDGTYAESGGTLQLATQTATVSPGHDTRTVTLRHAVVSSDDNFFATPLTFTLSGLSYTPSTSGSYFQLMVGSDTSVNPSTTADVFGVRIAADNTFKIAIKEDDATNNVFTSHALESGTLDGTVTGISVQLSATGCTVVFTTASGDHTYQETFSGITQAAWGSNGDSAFELQLQSGKSGSTSLTENVSLDSFSVAAAVPEPTTAAMAALAALGLAAVSLRRRASALRA